MSVRREDLSFIEPGYEAVENTVAVGQDIAEVLEGFVGKLHPEYRRAIELRFGLVDGNERTYAQIAREMKFSPSTARRRVESGRRELYQNDSFKRSLPQIFE